MINDYFLCYLFFFVFYLCPWSIHAPKGLLTRVEGFTGVARFLLSNFSGLAAEGAEADETVNEHALDALTARVEVRSPRNFRSRG
jgi:hypothetical protein